MLRSGEQCAYPGTGEPVGVGADGSVRFLFGAFGGSINIDTDIDGRRYDLAASDEGGGVWRIERVGRGSVEAGTAGAPLALSDLGCLGELSAAGVAIRIEGAVQARASVSSVVLTGRVDGEIVSVVELGRLSANDTAPFELLGAAPSSLGEFECSVEVEFFDIGALRHGQPLRAKWQGRHAP